VNSSSLVGVEAAAPSWNSTGFQFDSASSNAIVPMSVPTLEATAIIFVPEEDLKTEVKNTCRPNLGIVKNGTTSPCSDHSAQRLSDLSTFVT